MVAAAETISEPKLHGKRCGTSIPSAPSAVNLTDQRPRITDQKCGSSDDLFITHYSLAIERCASQGMALDPVAGLYYARNRNYSPSLGRWINQDPAGYINGANRYQFELGGPSGTTDPSGTKTTPLIPPPGKSTVGGNVSPQGASIHLGKTFPLGNHFYGGVQVSGHCSWSHGPPGGSVHVGIVYKGNILKWPIWPWNWHL